jgi:hypothetical protein
VLEPKVKSPPFAYKISQPVDAQKYLRTFSIAGQKLKHSLDPIKNYDFDKNSI